MLCTAFISTKETRDLIIIGAADQNVNNYADNKKSQLQMAGAIVLSHSLCGRHYLRLTDV